MRSLKVLFPALLALALTGCYKDQAQATLGGVAEAACKGDMNELRSLLMGDALAQYGTTEGAAAICKVAKPDDGKKVKLTDKKTSEIYGNDGRAKFRTYDVSVIDKKSRATLVTAVANCDVTWRYETHQNCSSYPYPYPGPGYPYPYPGYPYPDRTCWPESQWVDFEACKIASLRAEN